MVGIPQLAMLDSIQQVKQSLLEDLGVGEIPEIQTRLNLNLVDELTVDLFYLDGHGIPHAKGLMLTGPDLWRHGAGNGHPGPPAASLHHDQHQGGKLPHQGEEESGSAG